MTVYGYTRVSTEEQGRSGLGLAAQLRVILDRYPDAEVREEVASGGKASNRPVLQEVLGSLRRGDVLVVAKLDRPSRSLTDFANTVQDAQRRGWQLVVLDQGFDMSTANGRAMAGMLAVFAQWEREIITERIKAAFAEKRAAGWRPHNALPESFHRDVLRLHRRGPSQRKIANTLGTHKEQVARVLRAAASAERGHRPHRSCACAGRSFEVLAHRGRAGRPVTKPRMWMPLDHDSTW